MRCVTLETLSLDKGFMLAGHFYFAVRVTGQTGGIGIALDLQLPILAYQMTGGTLSFNNRLMHHGL